MKFTIAILLLGTLLGSVATCDITSCVLTGSILGTAGCTTYKDYIDCLNTQSSSCTSSVLDIAAKGVIDAAILSNTALRALLPCGTLLGSVATCDITSCSLTGSILGTAGCTTYKDYIDCLNTQSSSCTSSILDIAAKGVIDAAILSNTALRALLPCGGASLASISSIALTLSLLASLIKTHF